LRFANVLYMDIVGYSKLPMGQQTRVLRKLQQIIRGAQEFRAAEISDHLISLPTGDGLALVFFRDPIAPVQCAIEVSRALRDHPEILLRMGIHTGPVYQVADINANRNVAGGGINMAQRVMDCGDAGHILMSKSVAEVLVQLDEWADYVHDLGEAEVKHGTRVHLFNFYTGEVGNPQTPERWPRAARPRRPFKLPVAASLAGVALLLGFSALYVFQPGSAEPMLVERPAPAVYPERSLDFWLDVQKTYNGREVGKPFPSAGRESFASGWKFRFSALPREDGSLYLINEGPKSDGSVGYWVLYPTPEDRSGTPQLKANQQVETRRWNKFDENAGTEKVWIIWSEEHLPQLDALVKDAASRKFEVTGGAQIAALRSVIDDRQLPERKLEVDKDNERVTLKVRGKILVHPLELSHKPY
jgi:class 3 adenylate cyclase